MHEPSESHLPDDLNRVGHRLRAEKAQFDPVALDRMKRTVMARAARQRHGGFMKSRLATLATLVALVGGTGGAIAVGASGSHAGSHGGAAAAQYVNPKKKCKKGFHPSHGKCVKNGRKSRAGVRGQNNSRSRRNTHAGVRGKGTTRRAPGSSFTG